MKRTVLSAAAAVMLFLLLPVQRAAAALLVPVGKVIGLELTGDTVTIAAFDDALGHHARDAGLKVGDEILKIDGIPVRDPQDLRRLLSDREAELTVRRGTQEKNLRLTPVQTDQGPRLGVYLRQGIAGIGTVTFYDPATHRFGALGHGVSNPRGALLHMTQGFAYEARIQSVKKGQAGEPGQLRGSADAASVSGTLFGNTPQGVFGISPEGFPGKSVETAAYDHITPGPAVILSTVSGGAVQEYSVEILKIYPETRPDGRNFLLKVTDPQLLETTGGIVQGMSGSPILQDGKLVGAVTHVLVNDPTTGYGIFIGNMLDAAA